jgi:fructose-1,6-bisphosphatase/inositol monophosphatase family enzyme
MKQPSYSDFVSSLLRSLRAEIMASYGKLDHSVKEDFTVVTELDVAIEEKIVAALGEHTPHIGALGEELGAKGSTDTYWLIDPLDGTESYIRGLSGAMTIVGLIEDGVCTQSYIYDPVADIVYSAFLGGGAYANDVQLHVSGRPLSRAIIAIGSRLPYQEPTIFQEMKQLGVFHCAQYFGSAAKAVYLASGKIEGIVLHKQGGGMWDLQPTRLLAIEAGALFMSYDDLGEATTSYSLLTPQVHEVLSKRLKELW